MYMYVCASFCPVLCNLLPTHYDCLSIMITQSSENSAIPSLSTKWAQFDATSELCSQRAQQTVDLGLFVCVRACTRFHQ